MGKKQQKTATFRPFLATFFIFHKWAKNSKKVRLIALTFRPFFINGQKTAKKVRLYIALTFRPFLATFSIFHKWAKNSKKSKAIAFTFRPF